jgi:hypothetical protein
MENITYGISVDLSKNELQNAVIQNLAVFPLNPKEGQIFYHSSDKTYYGCVDISVPPNGTWKDLGQVLDGVAIVALINACPSIIDDDNLSANVLDSLAKRHSHSNSAILNAMEVAFTTALKTKIDGIATGATKTVNSVTNGNVLINGVEQIVYTHPTGTNPHGTTKADIGLSVVENKTSATIRSEITSSNVTTGLGYTPVKANGVSELQKGLSSAKPTATGSNKIYFETDTGNIWQDTVTGVWTKMGGQDLLPATATVLGGIKVGTNLTVTADGVLNANDNPTTYIIKEEEFVATSNQTVFTLVKGSYDVGRNTVDFYIYGQKQPSTFYTETNSTTITTKIGIEVGVRVIIKYIQSINMIPYPVHGVEHLSTGVDAIPNATTTQNGLMSDIDKVKLNGISTGANKTLNSATNGNIKIDGVEQVVYTHPTGTNPHGTTKADVGLPNVDNTTDANKPVSTAQLNALNLKINTSYIDIDGALTANSDVKIASQKATKTYVDAKVSALVNSSPATLDTLKELADALGSDPNFATTVATNLGNKVDKTTTINGKALSSPISINASDVGLANVTNTSDANKPVSTAQQTALNLKANLASPTFTGVPTAPTASTSTSSTQIATTAFVKAQKFAINIGDGVATEFTIVHNLGTTDTTESIKEISTNKKILTGIITIDLNNIKVVFNNPPTLNQYRVVIAG